MIVVRVELHSAITRKVTEIARMHIWNEGDSDDPRIGNYGVAAFRGRDAAPLAKRSVSITGWRRLDFHVWNLVRRALEEAGYDKGPKG